MKKVLALLTLVEGWLLFPGLAIAQQKTMEGRVVNILEEKPIEVLGRKQIEQKLEVIINRGEDQGKKITLVTGEVPVAGQAKFKINDKVLVAKDVSPQGETIYQIIDFVRRDSLNLLFAIFVATTLLIAGRSGVGSILSMGGTFVVIVKFVLPKIAEGSNPIWIAMIASLVVVPVTFIMSHGISKKTWIAMAGTFVALLVTSLLSSWMIGLNKLSGLSSEEAGFLLAYNLTGFDARGLLLAGIIIGSLGILDDITVAQAGIVEDIMKHSDRIKMKKVYERAMAIGKDHITSMVNTLILVYAGAAMPLLLLFTQSQQSYQELLNYEFMAEEIVRTLTGSIGLIAAVPVTTLLACMVFQRWPSDETKNKDIL